MFHIRETKLGQPSKVLPFSEVSLDPDQVNLSDDGTVPTTFTFQSPVYLEGETEYAMVLMSHSTDYTVYISRLGEVDITTLGGGESDQVIVLNNHSSVHYSSHKTLLSGPQVSTKTLSLNFIEANFKSTGSVSFFNPLLPESLEKS